MVKEMTATHTTADEFVKSEIFVWGEDYIFDLIDKGYVPTLLEENGSLKWTWRLMPNRP
jgi:hypothetical protein